MGVDEFVLADGIDDVAFLRSLDRAELVVDAMFGTGFRGALDGDAAMVAELFAASGLATLAVDIPSGVDGTTGEVRGAAVHADETVTFAALKPGLLFQPGRGYAGRVRVAEIGIDPVTTGVDPMLSVLEPSDLFLPRRSASGHKWSAGAFVVGGSSGMTGAPLMSAHAAARSGAGMVVCGVPGSDAAARAGGTELVIRALAATADDALAAAAADEVLADAHRFHAVAIGTGLGRNPETRQAVRRVVAGCPVPIVVDADGLNALAEHPAALQARVDAGLPLAILTPHAGEFARIAGHDVGADRVLAARGLAARLGAIVLLKGPGTVIAEPGGRAVVNRTDSSALATAGTGDVLTGIIAGLLATGADPFTAAATGAYVHGRAAWVAGTGDALVAGDLITALPPTLHTLRSGRDPGEAAPYVKER